MNKQKVMAKTARQRLLAVRASYLAVAERFKAAGRYKIVWTMGYGSLDR
jgi:hypothetical protein